MMTYRMATHYMALIVGMACKLVIALKKTIIDTI